LESYQHINASEQPNILDRKVGRVVSRVDNLASGLESLKGADPESVDRKIGRLESEFEKNIEKLRGEVNAVHDSVGGQI
jgi:hypothetical protein